MSKYTTELRYICEQYAGEKSSVGYGDVNRIIQAAIPSVFSFDWPIFDEAYRNVLQTKILKHYYTREISEESVGLWKLRLDTTLNEIMPYYNQLYKSELLEFNPLRDIDITTTNEANRTDDRKTTDSSTDTDNSTTTTNQNNTRSSTNRDLYSDTPQGAVQNLESGDYLTNARKVTDEGTEAGTGSSVYEDTVTRSRAGTDLLTSTEGYVNKVSGKSSGASYSKLLQEFRETMLNIDMQIINELSVLFIGLW